MELCKMTKFVQKSKDIIKIRGVTDHNKAEDGDEQVHGFIGNQLYPVFSVKQSSSKQFQNLHWTQIQNYLRHSYDSNQRRTILKIKGQSPSLGKPFYHSEVYLEMLTDKKLSKSEDIWPNY